MRRKVSFWERGSTSVRGFPYHLSCKGELDWVVIETCHCCQPISFKAALEFPCPSVVWSPRPQLKELPEASGFENKLGWLGPGYLPIGLGGYKDNHQPLLRGLEDSMEEGCSCVPVHNLGWDPPSCVCSSDECKWGNSFGGGTLVR